MEKISDKIKGIIGSLAVEVDDLNKEYNTEKITSKDKKDQLNVSIDIAQYRATNVVKKTMYDILSTLKEERVNPAFLARLKTLLNERL